MEADDILILLSYHHLIAAIHLVRCSGEVEQTPWATLVDEFGEKYHYPRDAVEAYARNHPAGPINMHLSYTTGSIVLSCAAVEARINELFVEATEGGAPLKQRVLSRLSKGEKVLDRYQVALLGACKDPFDPGAQPYQDVQLLFRLRNYLLHFEPKWGKAQMEKGQMEKGVYKTLREGLRSKNLHENPLVDPDWPYLPMRCMSYDCARWAARTAYAFVHEFLERMGLRNEEKTWGSLASHIEDLADLPGWAT